MGTPCRLIASRFAGLLALMVVAVGLVACGGDDSGSGAERQQQTAQEIEKAFLTGMVHHHESAIEMAKIAGQHAEDPFIKHLAATITTTQEREMGQMRSFHQRLFGTALKPDPTAHGGLGLTSEQAGMTHDEDTNTMLETADPFDRAFVDEMVPHHLGAIRMAKVVLRATKDPALRNVAESIVRTQQDEVKRMNAFRKRKYGSAVPARSKGEKMGDGEMGDGEHEGH